MSKENDLIRRSDVLARKEVITEEFHEHGASMSISHSVVTVDNINAIPAAPQPMSAVEYSRHRARLCEQYYRTRHEADCPLYSALAGCGGGWSEITPEAVAIVQKWAQEHPERSEEE